MTAPVPRWGWPDPVEGFIFDLDGTLYRGEQALPGALDVVRALDAAGVPSVFVTNNSTKSRADVAAKLASFGYEPDPARIVNSSFATAAYLCRTFAPDTAVFVIGAPALRSDIARAGLRLVDDEHAQVVVVGLDIELTYAKIRTAVRAIRRGAAFVITNPDRLIPNGDELDPGAGSVAAPVIAATAGHTEPVVIGKPEPVMLQMALQILGSRPARTVAVGDQLMTDVAGAQRCGIYAVLVETGVPRQPDAGIVPDLTVASLADLPLGALR